MIYDRGDLPDKGMSLVIKDCSSRRSDYYEFMTPISRAVIISNNHVLLEITVDDEFQVWQKVIEEDEIFQCTN